MVFILTACGDEPTVSGQYQRLTFELPANYIEYDDKYDHRCYRDADYLTDPVEASHYEITMHISNESTFAEGGSVENALKRASEEEGAQSITIDGFDGYTFKTIEEGYSDAAKYTYSIYGDVAAGFDLISIAFKYDSDTNEEKFDSNVEKAFKKFIKTVKINPVE